ATDATSPAAPITSARCTRRTPRWMRASARRSSRAFRRSSTAGSRATTPRSRWPRWSNAATSCPSSTPVPRSSATSPMFPSFCPDRGRWRSSPMLTNDEAHLREALTFTEATIPERISADSEVVENGLAKLVLSIIELIRRLLEKQALRRMDAGNLTDAEIERLGNALMKLEDKMAELKQTFGLTDDDLNLSLGPIRTLE